ncbi:pfs domain-containing protein [Colletotrichum paranaense]|uniref:Pfs domain-containing protein n=1 Tax=Colletotrichum paranaense TaxID=1914294 RepID=A0ABQ9SJM7_9PEZI|nr:pfs domain-containing protein [Colletotrichum paranaense]KAK1538101.1 pfs domain-containing protein [Colletotrichum paranaense]
MTTVPPRRREDFTVAVICSLPLEVDSIVLIFDELWDGLGNELGKAQGDTNNYTLGRIGRHNVVLVLLPGIGKVNAASSAAKIRSSYGCIRLAILCGICGGVPNAGGGGEVLLGDVIISKSLVQYDLGRRFPDRFETKHGVEDSLSRPAREIRSFLVNFETIRRKRNLEQEIFENLSQIQNKAIGKDYSVEYSRPNDEDVLFQSDYTHRHRGEWDCDCRESRVCEEAMQATCAELGCDVGRRVPRTHLQSQAEHRQPRVFLGSLGSGDTVMMSGRDRDQIAAEHKLVAFEMEGAGVWDNLPCIVTKGVANYADSHKNKAWQHHAAATAAAATRSLLDQWVPAPSPIGQARQVEEADNRARLGENLTRLGGRDRAQQQRVSENERRTTRRG